MEDHPPYHDAGAIAVFPEGDPLHPHHLEPARGEEGFGGAARALVVRRQVKHGLIRWHPQGVHSHEGDFEEDLGLGHLDTGSSDPVDSIRSFEVMGSFEVIRSTRGF